MHQDSLWLLGSLCYNHSWGYILANDTFYGQHQFPIIQSPKNYFDLYTYPQYISSVDFSFT